MALFDLLGRSWALGILWQLSDGSLTFRQLQDRCEGVSPTVLNKRLKELTQCGLVGHDGSGYLLTDMGRELYGLLAPFGNWSQKWSRAVFGEAGGGNQHTNPGSKTDPCQGAKAARKPALGP